MRHLLILITPTLPHGRFSKGGNPKNPILPYIFRGEMNKPFSNGGSMVINQLFIGIQGLLTQLLAHFIHLLHSRYHRLFRGAAPNEQRKTLLHLFVKRITMNTSKKIEKIELSSMKTFSHAILSNLRHK